MRYFLETLNEVHQLEQLIKNKKTKKVFQAIVREGNHIKRLTWFLIKLDINFERKPMGSGITCFYIDITVPYFLSKKGE